MKGLVSNVSNKLNRYKSTIHINNIDVLVASIASDKRASTSESNVKLEITNKCDTQDKSDWQNVFRLAAISVK